MRPLHIAVIALFLLAVVGGLWLVVYEEPARTTAAAVVDSPAQPDEAAATSTELDAAEASLARESSRAAAPATATTTAPAATKSAQAEVRAGVTIRGRLVDSQGAPVVGARVLAAADPLFDAALDAFESDDAPWMRLVETKSDERGQFELAPAAKKTVRLAVRVDGFVPRDDEHTIGGAPTAAIDLGDIALEASVILAGRVVDANGRPVANAELFRLPFAEARLVTLGGERGVRVATTDAAGRFRIAQLAAGPWRVRIASEAHPDKVESGETERAGQQVSGLQFALEDGTEIHGRVVQAPAGALDDLWVRASPRATSGDASHPLAEGIVGTARKARCQPDGSFILRGLTKDTTYAVFGRDGEREWGGRRRTATANVKSGDRGVSLPFQPETAIVASVVDAISGEPLTELDVRAGYQWTMPLMDEEGRRQKHFPEGRVRYGNLQPPTAGGFAQIAIECVGYLPYSADKLTLIGGQDLDLGVVRMTRAPLARVRVTDAKTGAPIAGARVTLREEAPADPEKHDFFVGEGEEADNFPGNSGSYSARTDAEGWAKMTSFPGQRAFVWISHAEYAEHQSEPALLPLAEDWVHEVKLVHGGTVVVTVLDAHRAPVGGRHVDHEGPGDGEDAPIRIGGDDDRRSDSTGRVTFARLVPGVHRFRLGQGNGNMIAMEGGGMVQMRRTIEGLPDTGPAWSEIAVEDGESYTLELAAPASSQLTGRITESGKPLVGATVRLAERDAPAGDIAAMFGEGKKARTNGKGEFTIDDVEVGEYRATISHTSRSMPHDVDVEVRDGENELDVELSVAIVEGRVTDHEARPLAGVRVRAEIAKSGGAGGPRMMATAVMITSDGGDEPSVMVSSGNAASAEVLTDADGKYRLRGVVPDVDIVVKATGKEVQPGESPAFHVAPDQVKGGVDLKLEQGGTLEVKVAHADGRAAATYLVRAEKDASGGEPKIQLTGPSGVAKFTGLPPGEWRVHVQSVGGGPQGGGDSPADQDVAVKVGETATARFEVP